MSRFVGVTPALIARLPQLPAASGSAAAPTYSYAADTGTGIFLRNTSTLGIALGGTQYFDIATDKFRCRSAAGIAWTTGTATTTADTGMGRNAAGVAEINSGTNGTYRDLKLRSVILALPASVTPATNGDVQFELTSNSVFTVRAKGSDGTVRSGTVALV